MKKYFVFALIIGALIMPRVSLAATSAEIQAQINAIMAQIQTLQAQLAQLQAQQGTTAAWCYDFNRDLQYGQAGTSVYNLQIALGKEGFSITQDEKNQKNFGESTADAVVGFQQKYKEEILTPLGLKYGTGYVGKATRAKLNSLYGCGITPTPTPTPFITTASLPNGTAGMSYSASISASGGSGSYMWRVSSGALPPGLSLSSPACITWPCRAPAIISGISTIAGSYTFTITVNSGTQTASKQFTFSIAAAPALFTATNIVATIYSQTSASGVDSCKVASDPVAASAGYWDLGNYGYCDNNIPKCRIGSYKVLMADTLMPDGSVKYHTACVLPNQTTATNIVATIYSQTSASGVDSCKVASDPATASAGYWDLGNYGYCDNNIPKCQNGAKKVIMAMTKMPDGSVKYHTACVLLTVTPSITVLSPNGGEQWQIGSTQSIKFSSPLIKEAVTLQLYRNNVYIQNIGSTLTSGDGSAITYQWIVPTTLIAGTGYKIRAVISKEPSTTGYDFSDAAFSIVATTLPPVCPTQWNETRYGIITEVNPDGSFIVNSQCRSGMGDACTKNCLPPFKVVGGSPKDECGFSATVRKGYFVEVDGVYNSQTNTLTQVRWIIIGIYVGESINPDSIIPIGINLSDAKISGNLISGKSMGITPVSIGVVNDTCYLWGLGRTTAPANLQDISSRLTNEPATISSVYVSGVKIGDIYKAAKVIGYLKVEFFPTAVSGQVKTVDATNKKITVQGIYPYHERVTTVNLTATTQIAYVTDRGEQLTINNITTGIWVEVFGERSGDIVTATRIVIPNPSLSTAPFSIVMSGPSVPSGQYSASILENIKIILEQIQKTINDLYR